ncbi:hypothetical protein QZM46_09705 [Burkholderia vietnamiensis]|uniref:hypothetical protein n=1 Tax=Burkholderia vietnamiensis TaxID=60552 RepID=UPI001CF21D57|nr:hypothetical protein [Burkholderia vietnamiensis]MDN7551602.1 hypothetical protein [Burkholderia vietnamiensis]MDN8067545.1 hypothetical protein [Burkholderia vietnamiensis]
MPGEHIEFARQQREQRARGIDAKPERKYQRQERPRFEPIAMQYAQLLSIGRGNERFVHRQGFRRDWMHLAMDERA